MPNYLTLVIHVYPAKVVRRLGIQLSPRYRVFHRPGAGPESAKTHSPLPAQHQTRGPRLQDPNASQSPKWAARRNRSWPLGGTVSIQPSPTTSESSPPSMSATVTFPSPTYPHSNLPGQIHTLQYHVLAYTELPRQSLSRNRHPSASWSHPTSAQVYGTYTHSERRTPSPSRTLFQRS